MKLNKLYSNRKTIFPDIKFNDGLNVIYGEIRDPKNINKTTHNIGKTTFVKLVDFCLLKGVSKYSFWRKNLDALEDFTFFLEISFSDKALTIRRSFENDTRVALKFHKEEYSDLRTKNVTWDHQDITINNAKEILDGHFDFSLIKPWDYRKITSYLLRTQEDYTDIFRLSKHRGKDIEWKPQLAQILGLDGHLVQGAYEIDEEINQLENKNAQLSKRVTDFKDNPDKLNGLIQVAEEEIDEYEGKLRAFDFKEVEDEINKNLVDEIEKDIADLNNKKYYINLEIQSIKESLNKESNFSLDKTQQLFKEAGVLFGEQIVKEYEDLIDFNKKITKERKKYLQIELREKTQTKKKIEKKLTFLNSRRKDALSKIKEKETFNKYKKLGDELTEKKVNLLNLKSIKEDLDKLVNQKEILDKKEEDRKKITKKMKRFLNNPSRRYSDIKSSYNSVINKVLDRTAIINSRVNSNGNYSFDAPFVDEEGTSTTEDEGHSFKKLQCIAFDSSIVMNSLDLKFPHFVIHDGVLETLENRVKLNLLELFKEQASEGLQEIITVLDSHLPELDNGQKYEFDDEVIVRTLHDQGDNGRLFKMPAWHNI